MFIVWTNPLRVVVIDRWLPILGAIVAMRWWFDGWARALQLLPMTLGAGCGLALAHAAWRLWREQRRSRRG